MTTTDHKRPGIWRETRALLGSATQLIRAGGAKLLALILVSQIIIVAVATPVIGWLFRQALRSAGMPGLDLGNLRFVSGGQLTLTLSLIFAIVAIVFVLLVLQFTSLIVLLRWPQLQPREFLRELGRVLRKLARPGSVPLLLYMLLLVPLTGFGFTSLLTRGISIPLFVPGELEKSTSTAIGYAVFMLLLALLNLRLALTIPAFVLTTGNKSARTSWRLTRGFRGSMPLVLAGTAIFIAASVVTLVMLIIGILPTAFTDAFAPQASPVVAAFSLGIAQIIGVFLTGLATSALAGVLITAVRRGASRLPNGVALISASPHVEGEGSLHPRRPARRRMAQAVAGAATLIAIVLGFGNIATMQRLSDLPQSYVLAHRGFSGGASGGVENTLGSLDAAKEVGADFVEMDVMQTKDGQFVAMHDVNLSRLAGQNVAVKDLTLDEITQIEVTDRFGHTDMIPSFADYVRHAQEIEMPLLIEIKLSGAETPDHVDRLIAELEDLDALTENIYHSLDAPSVNRLKMLRPDLTVGYTMAFAAVDVPDTPADFIVVEEWSATEAMQRAAHAQGLSFMAWTVNDDAGIREHLRRNTDGIITDDPDVVIQIREEMQDEQGLTDMLIETLARFVTIV